MNKEKQIEEMAFNLIMATSPLGVKDLTKQFDYKTVATDLYELYGWRKADEVALEAIDKFKSDIMRIFIDMCCGNDYNKINLLQIGDTIDSIYDSHIAELKKKYTEDGK